MDSAAILLEQMRILFLFLMATAAHSKTLDGAFYPSRKAKGVVVYLSGGGCLLTQGPHDLELDSVGQQFLQHGYSVWILEYRSKSRAKSLSTPEMAIKCRTETERQLAEIRETVAELPSDKPIYIYGHSYGAYLVNLLATSSVPGVQAYISSHGAWDPRLENEIVINTIFPESVIPVAQAPRKLAPILVLHSEDDAQVSFAQVQAFRNWVKATEGIDYTIKTFPSGGHLIHSSDYFRTIFSFLNNHSARPSERIL